MINFILGIIVGAAFAPFWMILGNSIWSRVKNFIDEYKASKQK